MAKKDLVGTTLGQYELVEVAGEGGIATVYKAYQRGLERWVAVKVLHVRDKEMLARFKREARAVAQLRHRNILMVYQYGEERGWPFIAMEYVEGGTLEDYLQGEPMKLSDIITLAIPIADALREAHSYGLIHRDVKPANILMPQTDWPLLTDFGLVKIPDAKESITVTGVVIGTPAYIAPEQALGKKADHRADIYSLGVILFEMITGHWPFEYENANLLMLAHISEPIPSPRKLNPGCPAMLEKIILKATEKSPDDRFADMQEMIDALTDLMGASTLQVPTSRDRSRETSRVDDGGMPPRPAPGTEGGTKPLQGPAVPRGVRLLLSDQDEMIEVPAPSRGAKGLIIGRRHGKSEVDIDFGPYGAAKAGVSRQHAQLTKSGTEWEIDDLGSLNGTYVNNVKIAPGKPQSLKNGDVIRCSTLSFVFLMPEKSV